MDIDLDLYRHELRVSTNPLVRLSAMEILGFVPDREIKIISSEKSWLEMSSLLVSRFVLPS